ncbi:glycosyltransferase family 34 protein, partial [Lepidopterella palustris CBS 459.81]
LGARPRIGKVTILFGTPSSAYERALRTHELHDRLHNYPLHVLRSSILDNVWTKPAYILSILLRELAKPEGERLQWLLWVDGDTIILNPYVPIEALIPPEDDPEWDDVQLLVSHDWNGLNNGVFPVRVSIWSVELFSAILSFRFYRPDQHLTFRDQSAMDFLLQDDHFSPNVIRAPQRWFNAYQGEVNETLAPFQVRRGDLLVHFAGVGDRDERMRYWLSRAEKHAPDWEVDFRHTSYPEETADFW